MTSDKPEWPRTVRPWRVIAPVRRCRHGFPLDAHELGCIRCAEEDYPACMTPEQLADALKVFKAEDDDQ